jgi:hypothetical protein
LFVELPQSEVDALGTVDEPPSQIIILREAIPQVDSPLGVVVIGGWREVVGELAGHSFLEGEQLFAAKDIKGDGRKLALLDLAA